MSNGGPRSGSGADVRRLGRLPVDLAAVVVLVGLAHLVVLAPVLRGSPVRVVLGLVFVLVLPGYAVVAALFPDGGPSSERTGGALESASAETVGGGIDGLERAALSLAVSIPVVSLVGLGLSLTPLGVGLSSVLPAVAVVTLGGTAVAAYRRRQLPPERRFRVPYRAWLRTGREAVFGPDSRRDLLVNAVLGVSILLAAGSVTFAVAAPTEGEAFTEFYLLTENETGDLVAGDYPTEFTTGESRPVVVGIENHEGQPVGYTVVVALQRVRTDGTVLETRELDRFSVELDAGSTWHEERSVTPTTDGRRLRVAFLLYRGDLPANPSVNNAYRSTDLWVTVR